MQFLTEWLHARHRPESSSTSQQHDTLKFNIDAAIFESQQQHGLGICIRDHQGMFVKNKTVLMSRLPQPREVEALI